MKAKKGFIVKYKNERGQINFEHLISTELHLINEILKIAKDNIIEIKQTTFIDNKYFSDFITQTF